MAEMTETWHEFHAEAHVLSGDLRHPVEQKIERHAPIELKDRKGGHLTRLTDDVNIEGLVTFKSGRTRVSGSMSTKKDHDPKNHGFVTLATSVVEGLNVFEVITVDRIVSQVSTDHPYENGHFPHVTFLGSQFDNLRANGGLLTTRLNLGICGQRPRDDTSYLSDRGFLTRAKEHLGKIVEADFLAPDVKADYTKRLTDINNLIKGSRENNPKVTCSIVASIDNLDAIPIPGVRAVGHVLFIPDFGTVSLGEVEVSEQKYEGSERPSNYFELMMFKMKLGCIGGGTVNGGGASTNGNTHP
jgi:hypothetical protein